MAGVSARNHSKLVALGVVAVGCLLSLPTHAAEPTVAAPTRDRPATEPERVDPGTRTRLLLTGAAVTVGWYGLSLGASYAFRDEQWAPALRIPVAGPFLSLRDMGCNGNPNCGNALVAVRSLLAIVDGIGQVGGLGVILESFLLHDDAGSERLQKDHARVRALPIVAGRGTIGLGVVGEF